MSQWNYFLGKRTRPQPGYCPTAAWPQSESLTPGSLRYLRCIAWKMPALMWSETRKCPSPLDHSSMCTLLPASGIIVGEGEGYLFGDILCIFVLDWRGSSFPGPPVRESAGDPLNSVVG